LPQGAYEELPHVKNKEIPCQISVSIALIKLLGEMDSDLLGSKVTHNNL
jgi:hypothetical protein